MSTPTTETTTELALAFQPAGFEEIPATTILTRLNYYDGKFLRADDLRVEQDYHRRLAELGARAGGAGLVYGFDLSLGSGDQLTIGGGLGFDASGRALYLPGAFSVGLQALVTATSQAVAQTFALSDGASGFTVCGPDTPVTTTTTNGAEFYLITIAHAEEACGDEEVFGKLCDDGCATSTDRAYVIEGVVVRARPYRPSTPFATSKVVQLTEKHIRSQLVSAAFADERLAVPSLISKAGLLGGAWCTGAAAPTGWEVPIAVVGTLSASSFVDEWIVRRERMDTPPRRYWAWTMAMRPWEAYLAQILQFQCQLPSALAGGGGAGGTTDPCAQQRDALGDAVRYIGQLQVALAAPPAPAPAPSVEVNPDVEKPTVAVGDVTKVTAGDVIEKPVVERLSLDAPTFLEQIGGIARLQNLQSHLSDILRNASAPSQRILVDGGIVELPPAGYLPVTPGTTPPVDVQVRRLLGDGVDLRFCVTTPDYIPHALEERQHMDRISLLQGLDDPSNKPPVDILVPNGVLGTAAASAQGWDTQIAITSSLFGGGANAARTNALAYFAASMLELHGVGRSAPGTGSGGEFAFAGPGSLGRVAASGVSNSEAAAAYGTISFDTNPFTLGIGGTFTITAAGAAALEVQPSLGDMTHVDPTTEQGMRGTASATFTVGSPAAQSASGLVVTASGQVQASATPASGTGGGSGSIQISVQITQNLQTSPPTYEVAVTPSDPDQNGEILLWASWQGSPLNVQAAAEFEQQAGTEPPANTGTGPDDALGIQTPLAAPVVAANLVENPAVFSSSNQLNVDAHQALQTLTDAFSDSQYTGSVATHLFDPTVGGANAAGVTATLDWVLFERRRHKDCQQPQVVAPPATKTYSVYVIAAADAETYKLALSGVINDDATALKRVAVQQAGTASFTAGTATLTSSPSSVLAAWNAAQPGPQIAAAVFASAETDEPAAVLEQRLLSYQSAVSSVSTPRQNEVLRRRGTVTSLPSGGVDGQLVFITLNVTVCHQVYVTDVQAWEEVAKFVEGPGIAAYLAQYGTEVTSLGTISFEDLTATVSGTPSLQTLGSVGRQGEIRGFYVVTQSGVSSSEPLTDQAGAILSQLGGTADYDSVQTAADPSTATWPASVSCPIISVLGAQST